MVTKLKEYGGFLVLGTVLLLIYKFVDNYKEALGWLQGLLRLLTPFFWGFAIAYFLNPLMDIFERKWKLKRMYSLALVYVIFFGVMTFFVSMIAPVVINNIKEITQLLPDYGANLQKIYYSKIVDLQIVKKWGLNEYINEHVGDLSKLAMNFLNMTLNSIVVSLIGFTSGVIKFLVGIIISLYLLLEKETFTHHSKRLILAVFGPKKSVAVIDFFHQCDQVFKNFFVGKAIDSLIVGMLCYLGLRLLKIPYAMLLSTIVGVFNMIPYVGPFIGAFPAMLITLLSSGIVKVVWVCLFILVLQQLDGNIIGPKILGDKVGISPFYIILAVTLGGGYFGVLGMLLAVSLFKIAGIEINKAIEKKIFSNN